MLIVTSLACLITTIVKADISVHCWTIPVFNGKFEYDFFTLFLARNNEWLRVRYGKRHKIKKVFGLMINSASNSTVVKI